jgi:hypothetical protein
MGLLQQSVPLQFFSAPGRGEEWLESVPEALEGWARHDACKGSVMRRGCGEAIA